MDKDVKDYCRAYYILQNQQAERNIEKSKEVLGDLLYAHGFALGTLECIIKQYLEIPGKTNETIDKKLWLISAFYQGIETCEELLKQGRYTIAAPILRQEYEIIAKLHELDDDRYDKDKVANPKYLHGFQRAYGMLSELTHLLKNVDDIIFRGECSNGLNRVELVPIVHEDLIVDLYGLHIYFIIIVIHEVEVLYSEMYGYEKNSEIEKNIEVVLATLIQKGVIRYEE